MEHLTLVKSYLVKYFFLNKVYQRSMDQRVKRKEAKAAFVFFKLTIWMFFFSKSWLKMYRHSLIMLKHDIWQYFFCWPASKHWVKWQFVWFVIKYSNLERCFWSDTVCKGNHQGCYALSLSDEWKHQSFFCLTLPHKVSL